MSKQFQFRIGSEDKGQRLDVFLASRLGQFSRMRIANLLATDACLVNRQIQKAGYHLAVDDWVEMTLDDTVSTSMSAENIALEILYEDEQIVIVIKPSGMLVHPNKNTKSGTLANALAYHLNQWRMADGEWPMAQTNQPEETNDALNPQSSGVDISQQETIHLQFAAPNPQSQAVVRPGLVHRLDRATSGLMVIAKTQKALSILTKHFHKRLVKKLYLAVVEGALKEDEGSIIAPIGHDESKKPPRWVMADGKYAETRFRVLERRNGATLVELEPVTGRTNQLRIHCAYLGHPIIGDAVYGTVVGSRWSVAGEEQSESTNQKSESNRQAIEADNENQLLSADHRPPTTGYRLCLHAAQLAFHHPAGGRWMEFQAVLPEEIQRIWDSFEQH